MKNINMEKNEIKGCSLLIYPRNIWVACGEEYRNILSTYFTNVDYTPLEDIGYGGGCTIMVRQVDIGHEIGVLIYIRDKVNNKEVIVHECVHAAMDICGNLGIEYDFTNQEPLAYLTDYIYRIVYNMINGGCDNTIPKFTKSITL